ASFGGMLSWMSERLRAWGNSAAVYLIAPFAAAEEFMRSKDIGAAVAAFRFTGHVDWMGMLGKGFEVGSQRLLDKAKTLGGEIKTVLAESTAGTRDFFSDYGDAIVAQFAEDSGVMGRITDAIKGAIGKGLKAAGNQALQDIDWDKMLEGLGAGKAGSDAAGKAKQALADLGEEGRKLYESLNVAVGVVAKLKEQIAALTASGHWTPETTSLLAAETWESIANQSRETIAAIIAGASALDEALGRELDALREKALQAQASDIIAEIRPETLQSLDDLSEKLRTIVDAGRMTGHVPEWLTAKYWDVLSENIEEAKAKFPEMAAAIEDMRARLDASAGKSLFEDMLGTTALNEAMVQLDQIAVHLDTLRAAGKLSTDELKALGEALMRTWGNMAPEQIQLLIDKLREIDTVAAEAADGINESTDFAGKMTNMADKIGQIGNALAQLGPEYQDVAEAATFAGYAIKFMIDVATGNWITAAIDGIAMLASGMKMFGDKTEEVSKGFDRVMEEIEKSWASWADRLTDTLVEFIKTGKASFKDFVDSVLEDMLRITIRYGIIAPILDVVGINTYAKGAAFEAGNVIPFAKGGAVVNAPTLFPMAGGKTGIMGEAGAEAIMPLKRLPDGKLGVSASGDQPPVVVNVIDQRTQDSPPVQVRETRGVDGSRQIEVLVRDAVAGAIARGELDAQLRRTYGLARKGA
ncbi:MAG: phage tail tape measure C-terminal domain-containing protein, partial [Verrucomicrobiota bacterium]|nr:phage tail tape measure C-terminal domain-containing protein [Verrucomicrobiota bacterium]